MEATQTNAPDQLNQSHIDFLNMIKQLTDTIAPIAAALVPGAAPAIAGVKIIESVASQIYALSDSAKTTAANVVGNAENSAPVLSTVSESLPPIVEESVNATDPSTMAAASISANETIPVEMRLTKLEVDFNTLMEDIAPIIEQFKNDWAGVKKVLKQFGF